MQVLFCEEDVGDGGGQPSCAQLLFVPVLNRCTKEYPKDYTIELLPISSPRCKNAPSVYKYFLLPLLLTLTEPVPEHSSHLHPVPVCRVDCVSVTVVCLLYHVVPTQYACM